MPSSVYMFKVYRLLSSEYSVPKGSHCILENMEDIMVESKMETLYFVRWLPPLFNLTSGPIQEKDLELVGELGIPAFLISNDA